MLRLIKMHVPSTGKPHLRNRAPPCLLNLRARSALLRERSEFGHQGVTKQIEFVLPILSGRVECGLCRRQCKDQPPTTRIHGFEPQNVAEKRAIRLGVFTVDNNVSARNHLPLKKCLSATHRFVRTWHTSHRSESHRTMPQLN